MKPWTQHHNEWRGKVIGVPGAIDADSGAALAFNAYDPLFVFVNDGGLGNADVILARCGEVQVYWDVTVLPWQLPPSVCVSWIDAGTYKVPEGKEGWLAHWDAVDTHPFALFLDAQATAQRLEFLAVLEDSKPLAGDWLEERGGDRVWLEFLRLRVPEYEGNEIPF